jgi:hypothetical protein
MSLLPGEKYVPSNKFNVKYWTMAIVVAFFLAILVGRLYALISFINPIIYLNFLLLAGTSILLVVIIMLVKLIGRSRNKFVDLVSGLVVCGAAWLAQWAHIEYLESSKGFLNSLTDISGLFDFIIGFADKRDMGISRLGSRGTRIDPGILFLCYMVECGAFLAPVYFLRKSKDYYCEDCANEYKTITGYISSNEILHTHTEEMGKGDLVFLQNSLLYKALDTLPLDPTKKPGIGTIEFHYCEKCNTNAIVNVKSGILKYGDKKKREIGDANFLLQDIYITDESRKLIVAGLGIV